MTAAFLSVHPAVIYALKDPDTNNVRYVGKANNLDARMRSHMWEARHGKLQTHKARWLRSLSKPPDIEILELVDELTWVEREQHWIATFRNEGARLTNFADGGQGWPTGIGHSDKTKAKLRAAALAHGTKPPSRAGTKATEETRAKLRASAATRGIKPPPTGGWNKGLRKTHCVNGHELTLENRYDKGRGCKKCRSAAVKRYQQKKKLFQQKMNAG